jgi:hypothetical protein
MSPTADDTAVTAPPAIDWQSVETAYRTTARSVREIAGAHGVSHVGILKRAKRDGWVRLEQGRVDEAAHLPGHRVAISSQQVATEIALAAPTATSRVTAPQSQSAATPVTATRPPTKGNTMLFRSPDSENLIHLANTAGHTAIVPAEFGELPPMFHRDAILAGAEVSGTLSGELEKTALLLSADKEDREAAADRKAADAAIDPKWLDKKLAADGVRLPR